MAVEEAGVKLVAEGADRFEKATKDARKALLEFVMATQDGSRDIERASDQSGQAVVAFVEESGRAYNRLDAFSEIAIGALRRVGEIAVNAMIEAGKATAQFIQDSVNVAGNFEATLNRFSAVTGESLSAAGMEVEDFSDLFLEMGAETQYSAQQAAEAAVNLAKGGIDPATIAAGGLQAALSLAAAGELELATAAEITAKQLGIWSSTGVTAADVANLMAQAANASTVDVDELALGMANVGGVAKVTGLSLQETVQTMALLSPGFSSAADAGTSFKTFLSSLIPTTDKAKDAMKDLGLATSDGSSLFFDAQGQFIGMENAAGLLASATAGLSEEEKQLALETIFGQDAIRAAALIAEQGAAGFSSMGESMNAAGGAAEQAAARNQGYNFALEEMRGSMETLEIVLGTALLPALTELVQNHITPGINEILKFAQAILESEDPMAALVAKIDEVVPGFSSFLATIQGIPAKILEISTALQDEFAPEIQLAQSIFETAMIVMEDIATAVMDTVMGAISEFTSSFGTSSRTWEDLLQSFGALWNAIQPIIMGVLATIGALLLVFLGVATGVFTGIINAIDPFLAAWANIVTFITVALQGVQLVISGFVDLVIALFQGNAEGVLKALGEMVAGVIVIIGGMVGAIISAITGMISTGLAVIEGFVLGIIEFFARLYHELVGGSIIVDLVNDILGWFDTLLEDGKQLVTDLVNGIKDAFSIDWGAIGSSIISGITNGITGAAGELASAATNAASSAYDAMTGFLGIESPSKLFMEIGALTMEGFALGIDEAANLPSLSLEDAAATLAMELPSMMSGPVSQLAPSPVVNNTYQNTNIYEAPKYDLNVRTQESTGSISNTIRGLQSISRVRGGS